MECLFPPALSDEALWSIIDDVATDTVLDHLRQCPYCQDRLQRQQQQDDILSSIIFRIDCPPLLTLSEFSLDLLDSPSMSEISTHLQTCLYCQHEHAELQAYLTEQPSPPKKPRLSKTYEELSKRARNWLQVFAATITPSSAQPAPALRGRPQDAGTRTITANASDGTTLQLRISRVDDGVQIRGMVIGDPTIWTGALVDIEAPNQTRVFTHVNDVGLFDILLSEVTNFVNIRFIGEEDRVIRMIQINNMEL